MESTYCVLVQAIPSQTSSVAVVTLLVSLSLVDSLVVARASGIWALVLVLGRETSRAVPVGIEYKILEPIVSYSG